MTGFMCLDAESNVGRFSCIDSASQRWNWRIRKNIKPSNVISVAGKNGTGDKTLKVGDLGRVTSKNHKGPFDSREWPGDWGYSPPALVSPCPGRLERPA